MFNSTISSFTSLRSLPVISLQSENATLMLDLLAAVKSHSNELTIGVLGLLSARAIYRLLKKSTAFRQLDGPAPASLLWGDEALLFSVETSLTAHEELLNRYGAVCKIKGIFGEDRLWIADPRAMNDIVLKSYDSFHEPEPFLAWIRLTSGNHILTTNGHKHKMQRKVLNPVFTAKHMRNLTPTFTAIAHHLENIIASRAQANGANSGIVDIYKWMSNVALEMVGQAGMGYSFGVLEDKEPEYLKASHQLFPLINELWYIRPFLATLIKLGPAGFRRAVVNHLPFAKVQEVKNVTNIMDDTAIDIYQKKRLSLINGTLESEIAAGQDIISMLLKQNKVLSHEEQMSEEEIIAHVNALVFAGHDTTSGALARTFYLLAQHPDIQNRVREEVREAHRLYGRDLDYDQLNSLTFLDAYPVKSKDGKTLISNIHVPKGTHMYLSLGSVNRDKQTWGEDANKFNPDRWLEAMPTSVSESKIPGVYSNMGFKFSQLEMKVVFSLLISSFKFELGDDEIEWTATGVVKPLIKLKDGTIDLARGPTLPMKVTVLE